MDREPFRHSVQGCFSSNMLDLTPEDASVVIC
jgi:hypothetical protein